MTIYNKTKSTWTHFSFTIIGTKYLIKIHSDGICRWDWEWDENEIQWPDRNSISEWVWTALLLQSLATIYSLDHLRLSSAPCQVPPNKSRVLSGEYKKGIHSCHWGFCGLDRTGQDGRELKNESKVYILWQIFFPSYYILHLHYTDRRMFFPWIICASSHGSFYILPFLLNWILLYHIINQTIKFLICWSHGGIPLLSFQLI